jgi:hypothetical protein
VRKSKLGVLALAVAAGLGVVSARSAQADTVVATITGVIPGSLNNVVSLDGTQEAGGVGAIQWTPASASNNAPFNAPFATFCIDIPDHIFLGATYTFTTGSLANAPQPSAYPTGTSGPMGAGKAAELGELYAQDFSAAGAAGADGLAAFQLAIWNIVYDTDTSVSPGAGTFFAVGGPSIDPISIGLANTWLSTLTPSPTAANVLQALIATPMGTSGTGSADGQDQIVINPFQTTGDTPLPSAAVGGGVLLAGLAAVSLKKNRSLGWL